MKLYKVNKNVEHNGKSYPKDGEIKESDEGFKDLLQAGHAEEVFPSKGSEGESEEKSEQPVEPKQSGKSKK